jgi:hypothetical protein
MWLIFKQFQNMFHAKYRKPACPNDFGQAGLRSLREKFNTLIFMILVH